MGVLSLLALSACSGGESTDLKSAGCVYFEDSVGLDIATPKRERAGLEVLIFDEVGVTFHLSPNYFAKRYSDMDRISYSNSVLYLKFAEGRNSYSYQVRDVDAGCGRRILQFSDPGKRGVSSQKD